jgi:hypothetical protein
MIVSQKSKKDHLSFTFIFMFVSLAECCSLKNFSRSGRVIVVDFQTFEKRRQTF